MTQPDVGTVPVANQGALFTQDQVNHFNAEAKRGAVSAYFKELGLDKPPSGEEFKAMMENSGKYLELQQGQKGDVERLTTENATLKATADKVPDLEAAKRRAEMAGDAGLKSRYHKYVEGKTDEEIEASIKLVLADVGGGSGGGGEGEPSDEGEQPPANDSQQQARTGTGALTPNPQQGTGGGGKPPTPTMQSGAAAYAARHGKKE